MSLGNLSQALSTANTGLNAMQSASSVVANNLANLNNPNYSRREAMPSSQVLSGFGIGVGELTIRREVNEHLLSSLRSSYSEHEKQDAKDIYNSGIMNILGDPNSHSSFANDLSSVIASLNSIINTPSDVTNKNQLTESLNNFAVNINTLSQTISDLREQANNEITTEIANVNQHLEDIEYYNGQILNNQSDSATGNMEDKRDEALSELSKLIDIHYYKDSSGAVFVYTKKGNPLLTNEASKLEHYSSGKLSASSTRENGAIDGIYLGTRTPENDITESITGGKIAALIDLRDKQLVNYQRQLDLLSQTVTSRLNEIHNSGTSFHPPHEVLGSQFFLDPAHQSIQFKGTEDSRIVILDQSGHQRATATIREMLQDYTGATTLPSSATLQEVSEALQAWLKDPTVGKGNLTNATVNFDEQNNNNDPRGHLHIDLHSNTYSIGFLDVKSNAKGAAKEDISIGFDEDGNHSGSPKDVIGFSNLFGLNDLYKDITRDRATVYETDALSLNTKTQTSGTLSFYDEENGVGVSANPLGTINLSKNDTLSDLAYKINHNAELLGKINAVIEKDDNLVRLKIFNEEGKSFVISDSSGTLSQTLGLSQAISGQSAKIELNETILSDSNKLALGHMIYEVKTGTSGSYSIPKNNNVIAVKMFDVLKEQHTFKSAGGINDNVTALKDYANLIVSYISKDISRSTSLAKRSQGIILSIENKVGSVQGVNLDEEISKLIEYQRSYKANAKVISVVADMMKTITEMIN